MDDDERFEPRLGRIGHQRGRRARSYLGRVVAAANLARGAAAVTLGGRGFSGSRYGRAAGVGRMLASRRLTSAYGRRRVVIKSRIVRLAGKGATAATAHLKYLQRDGTTRDGAPGVLYGPDEGTIDGKAFHERASGDRHQFRFIVSPEDGAEYDDLRQLARRLMQRVAEDLGTKLDWVAVDHFNTGHPHTHIIVRGKDHLGADLVIARDYLASGMRERAAELVDIDLGPRSADEIERALLAEVVQERLTSIDHSLLRSADGGRVVAVRSDSAFEHSLHTGRLNKLASLGLAEPIGAGRWRLAEGLDDTLRRMGERGDIVRTMQREFSRARLERPAVDQVIYDPASATAAPLVGRVIARGLADEYADRHWLIVDATDGRSHYVTVGKGEAIAPLPRDAIVKIEARHSGPRPADRTVAAIAGANRGRYDIDIHLRHDPNATEEFATAHVRRLESLRRAGVGVNREPSGTWKIPPDHLERVAEHETRQLADRPVSVEILSSAPLEQLMHAEAATWLDREATAGKPTALRDAGFGREVGAAQTRRSQWLIEQGLAHDRGGRVRYHPDTLATLQRRELLKVAATLSEELALPFRAPEAGAHIEGVLRRRVDLLSGQFAIVERSKEFTLVPWRPTLEARIGKAVSGIVRESGISWTFGRGRGGPTVE